MKNMIHLYLDFAASKVIYECYFSLELTLMENMCLLFKRIENDLIDTYKIDKYFIIYEKRNNIKLNLFVELKKLNLIDDLTLVVY